MLHEINSKYLHSSETNEGLRWFNDFKHDLFVWLDTKDRIVRFQFCYDKNTSNEQSIEWVLDHNLFHQKVLSDEGWHSMSSPILVPNGAWNPERAREEFEGSSLEIRPEFRSFILGIIDAYIKNNS